MLQKTFATANALLALLLFASSGNTQNNSLGSWHIANAEFYLNNKWSAWSEVQLRSQKLTDQFFYHELKGGVNYRPNKNIGVLFGMGQYETYSNGGNFKAPVLTTEFRLWEQLTLVNNINRFKIEHRYRIEQRWRNDGYRNRFRYRLNPIIPINKAEIKDGTLFLSVFDEIFLTNRAQYFERNRFFIGMGYQVSTPFTLQIGWIRQFDYARNNVGSKKDFIQTTLLFRINKSKSDHDTHPGSID